MKQFKRIVKAAQKKEPEAFAKLYEQTYHEKYYIALKYMKHPSEAEDVLQEAYIKAWERLPSLKDADKFSSWLGQIVARTALDALKRKKPMLFSELTDTEGESEDFLSELPDDHQELQPELAYTEKERSEILGHMLDSLSDVQRLCMMMYYIEEMSIHEIAEILECSENTVKSRLNYGRKNMQKAAVKLEKEGYHFYGLSPVYLFLYLLQLEAAESGILLPVLTGTGTVTGVFGWTALKQFLFGTTVRKNLTRIFGGIILSGMLAAAPHLIPNQPEEKSTEVNTQKTPSPNMDSRQKTRTDRILKALEENSTPLSDKQYPDVIEGALQKGDLESLLLCAPEQMKNGALTSQEIHDILLGCVGNGTYPPTLFKETFDSDDDWLLPKELVNRFLSAITDFRLTEKASSLPDIVIMGDYVHLGGTMDLPCISEGIELIWYRVKINSARAKKGQLILSFTKYGRTEPEEPEIIEDLNEQNDSVDPEIQEYKKKFQAVLKQQKSGRYRIMSITPKGTLFQ